MYKLPRIKNLVVTDKHFVERESLNLSSESAQKYYNNQQNATIKLLIEPEMAYRIFEDFYESMVEKQPDGNFIVTVEWPEDNWLYNFILSFGNYVEVLEPEHLRNIIREEAQKILKKYL